MGKHEAAVIQASREAIKNQDFDQLMKITLFGVWQLEKNWINLLLLRFGG